MHWRNLIAGIAAAGLMTGCGDLQNSVLTNSAPSQPELFRSIDGGANAPGGAGMAGAVLLRLMPAAYGDGFSSPTGATRVSPRQASNLCCAQTTDMPDPGGRTNLLWVWGQFIDHDLVLTRGGAEAMPITVPTGDPFFDPTSTGTAQIGFRRSAFDAGTGTDPNNQRTHRNALTAFLDASMVYGSDTTRAAALRTFSGGKLKTSAGDLPPLNTDGLEVDNPTPASSATFFLCGDVRANENLALTSMHTLFVREHNRLADLFAAADPTLDDETLYQMARKRVGALIQVITYNEFLPALLGDNALSPYQGYNSAVDPGIDQIFSTAAFRIGHTMVSSRLLRLDANGQPIAQGHLDIKDGFFVPNKLITEGGIDPLFRGLAASNMQRIDTHLVDDLRNFLFGPPGAGGFDLASLNMQRGRDHGLPDYNSIRVHFGRPAAATYADVTSDVALQQKLAMAFPDINNIDPWLGLLAEDAAPGAAVGPTMKLILIDQFERLRDGDRFFYRNDLSLAGEVPFLEATRLSDIIRRNSGALIQDSAFFR